MKPSPGRRLFGLGMFAALTLGVAIVATMPAAAADAPHVVVAKECGACHMVYPPQLLPARSWSALLDGMANHFGENAALDPATTKVIADYLIANAGDAKGIDRSFVSGIPAGATPLRITDTPRWIREHKGEVSAADFANPKVKTKANCVACHRNAAAGNFDEE